jgi:YVTN family beta-propeller protein
VGAVWVASSDDGTLSRIDPRTRDVVKTIGLGFKPSDVAVTPSGVYVADPGNVSLVRVDTESNSVSEATRIAQLGTGLAGPTGAPNHIVFGGDSVWGDAGLNKTKAFRLRLATSAVDSIDLGSYTADAVAYTAGAVWTAAFSDGVVSRIDSSRNVVTATIPLGIGANAPLATALGAGPSGVWAIGLPPQAGGGSYGTDYGKPGRLFHIDPKPNGVVGSMQIGHQAPGSGPGATGFGSITADVIAVGDGGVWVANGGDGSLMQIEPARDTVVKTIQVGKGVDGVAVGDGYVWVSRL